MKTKILIISILSLSLLFTSCGGTDEPTELTEQLTDSLQPDTSTCDCESAWFNQSTILPPAEGPTSAFGASSTINCLFHQWSWQKFLYLTQVPSGETLPFFLSKMTQVTSEMVPVGDQNAPIELVENAQAGGGGLLTTNPTFGGGTNMVYYSIHISDEFKAAAYEFEAMILANPDSVNNSQTFPVGSVELKVSWVNVASIPANELPNYFTTQATINGTATTVAMLGMHVVGVVENHPEFIWATFEHNDLAAYYDWDATTNADVPVQASSNKLLFNSTQTGSLSDILWTYGDKTPKNPNNVFTIYKYGTPKVPGDGFMTTTSQANGQENYDNIDHLNQSVHDTIAAKGLNLWTNYFYNGSLWMNMDGLTKAQQIAAIVARVNDFGNANAGGPLRGSVNAFNISMETYEQTASLVSIHGMTVDSLMNCLVCHGPSSYLQIAGVKNAVSPTYISHIFMNYMSKEDPNMTLQDISKMRFKLFKAHRDAQ